MGCAFYAFFDFVASHVWVYLVSLIVRSVFAWWDLRCFGQCDCCARRDYSPPQSGNYKFDVFLVLGVLVVHVLVFVLVVGVRDKKCQSGYC